MCTHRAQKIRKLWVFSTIISHFSSVKVIHPTLTHNFREISCNCAENIIMHLWVSRMERWKFSSNWTTFKRITESF